MRAVHRRRAVGAMVVLTASSPVLSGCDFDAPLMPLGSPTPTATVEQPIENDVLFTIAVTTTDSSGQEIRLNLVAHAPQEWDAPGRESIKDEYIAQCSALGGGTVSDFGGALDEASLESFGSTLMVIDVTSTPAGATLSAPIELELGNPFYYLIATGDGLENPFASACYGGYQIVSTGTVSAIVNYETGSPEADLSQWRTGRYGFIAAYGSTAEFSTCSIALTPRAIAADIDEVDGWTPLEEPGLECAIGYQGE